MPNSSNQSFISYVYFVHSFNTHESSKLSQSFVFTQSNCGIAWLARSIFLRLRPDCFVKPASKTAFNYANIEKKNFHKHKTKRWLSIEQNVFFKRDEKEKKTE